MIIKNVLNKELLKQTYSGKAKYACIDKRTNRFVITNSPIYTDRYGNLISLKDIEYKIENAVLYIKGIRIFYLSYINLLERIYLFWSSRKIYKFYEQNYNLLEDPPKISEIIIHRWWWKDKKIMGYEVKEGEEDLPGWLNGWFKLKEEVELECAMSSFILEE